MVIDFPLERFATVALRKESVDRNRANGTTLMAIDPSLSARRAWIEIQEVATANNPFKRRSPQGERG